YGVSVEGVVGQDPASEANFAMLTQWIEECVTTHPECGLGSPLLTTVQCFKRPLPRRLIDVSCSQTSRSVFVWETVGQLGSYVALSHCWGSSGSPRWTTTLKTIEDRKKSIELAILPKTYQDAVKITWKLGQRYLWVDSLCTIQDSAEDWQRESANMGHIYENSLVTICASGAENSHVGCLAPRKRGPFHPVILEQQLGKEKLGRIYIYRQVYTHQVGRDPTGLFYANVEQCPLASRAWTIQERMLSPRNVHYGKEQIFWECTRQRAGEGGARFVQVGNWTNGLQSMYQLSVAERVEQEILKSAKPSQGYLTSARWFIYWYQIIEFYTARKLSRPSDKLPALSGLALETQRRTGDQYLAGLRATCLHHGLAWRVETDSVSSRPQSYRAPSWSWAAIDGPASYNAAFKTTVAAEDILPAIDILGAHVETAGFDGFGEVAAGWIQLKGKLKPAHFKRSAPKTIYEPRDPETDSEEVLGDYYDDIKQLWDSEILYCLQLSIFPFTEGPSIPTPHTVLVLQPTFGVVRQYRRVGAGTIHKTDWFDECPRTTITII
ncbi:MAG: hypothetical protein M1830_003891, partial [Pleopsidium flavum]